MNTKVVAVCAVIVLASGGFILGVVGPMLEEDMKRCHDNGGEDTVRGDVLYCEFDNGTGRRLGTGETPHELDGEVPDREIRGLVPLLPVMGGVAFVAIAIGIVQRYRVGEGG